VRRMATGEMAQTVCDRVRIAHNPEVATQQWPLSIGLSCAKRPVVRVALLTFEQRPLRR
jgi:hypothetical protein